MRIPSLLAILTCLTLCVAALAAEEDATTSQPAEVSYYRDIRPIFQAHCQGCHQPAKRSGEYVMTAFEQLTGGGESGEAAIVPGKPDESYLMQQIEVVDGEAAMPQDRPPLTESEIKLIAQWITAGAKDDSPASTRPRYDADHPPVYAAPPVITSLDYSPDGKLLAISGYHEVVLRNTETNDVAARLVGMSERIESAKFSPDGKRIAVAGGSPGRMGEVQIWNVAKKELELGLTEGFDTIYGASWSPDGKLVAFGCPDNTSRAIEADTGKEVLFNLAHSDWVLDTVFSVKGDHLVTVSRDRSMKLINTKTQRFIDNITSITPGALKGGLLAVDRDPKKDEVLVGGADGTPKIYRMYREKARKIGDDFNLIKAFAAMPGRVFDVAYSRDGERIVAGSSSAGSGEVRVYTVADGKQQLKIEIPEGGVFAVALSADGKRIASGGCDGLVRIHDATSGELLHEFPPVPLSHEE
jgi:mono/diheme cytochrome c family protein/roadblock/LC7 domain-containing protein